MTTTPEPNDPHNPFRLDGLVALVTGIGPGIGSAVARAFAVAGAEVIVAARTETRVCALVDELHAVGARSEGIVADVGDTNDRDRLVEEALGNRDAVHIVFNNAAAMPRGYPNGILSVSDEEWDQSLGINIKAPMALARAFSPGMKASGYGSIINVVSSAAFTSVLVSGVPYSVTKAGLMQLTRLLATELAPEIRVNAICPGTIDAAHAVRAEWRDLVGQIPLGRVGGPEEVAWAAVYLASPASSYTTAQCLFVDGGRVNS